MQSIAAGLSVQAGGKDGILFSLPAADDFSHPQSIRHLLILGRPGLARLGMLAEAQWIMAQGPTGTHHLGLLSKHFVPETHTQPETDTGARQLLGSCTLISNMKSAACSTLFRDNAEKNVGTTRQVSGYRDVVSVP
jgi:hypothetical protein